VFRLQNRTFALARSASGYPGLNYDLNFFEHGRYRKIINETEQAQLSLQHYRCSAGSADHGYYGLVLLNISSVGNAFKEDIRMSAYLRTLNKDTIGQIQQFISSRPYAKNVVYVDKKSPNRSGTKRITKTGPRSLM
jgi:hypothetical protein